MPDIKKIKTPDNVVYDIVDGGISAWARAENKPTYTADEIGLQGAYYVAGSGSTAAKTSSPYYATRWRGTNSAITSLYTGLMVNFRIDVAGNGSYGTLLSINDGEQHPVCANVSTMVGTRYAVGCIIPLVYDAAQTATVYINSSSSSTITGCWKIADYDSNTVTQTAVRDFVVGKDAGTLYRYQICLLDEHDGLVPYNNVSNSTSTYTKAVNTASFDPFRGMCWYGTTTAVSAGLGVCIGSNSVFLVYQQDARYSFNLNSGVSSSSVAANNGATVFSTSYKYAVGAYCTYAGELYKCKTAITTAGAWNASNWTKISFYDSTTAYAVNDECIHSGYVWKCTTAIDSGGEAWNAAHWTYATMTGMISSYPVYIKAKYNKATHLATFQQDTTSTSYLVRSGITQGLPEEDPNTGLGANEMYIYIFVGRSYTCYNLGMFAEHPVYYWNEIAGKATIFTGAEEAVVPTKTSDLTNDGDDGAHPFLATNDVATVATTGSYNDLSNKPTIPTVGTLNTNNTSAQTASSSESFGGTINLHKVAKTGTYSDLIGTPTIPSAPGTLNTTATTAQSTSSSEALSGSIALHKIAKTGTYSDLIGKPTLGTAAAKDTTNTYSATGTDPITGTGVAAALATLPTPMQFKGTVGSSGTIEWSALPTAASGNTGYVYKVITDHATAPICKDGDTIISNGSSWVVIPSGDEPAGTVTNVAISNGGGLSVSGSPITSSGTITISHSDTSSQASVSNSGRTYIQSVTLDTYGHVTGLSSATETVTDTNTTYSLNVSGTGDNANKLGLTAGGSGSGTTWVTLPYAATAGSANAVAWANVTGHAAGVKSDLGIESSGSTYLKKDGTWGTPSNTWRPVKYSTITLNDASTTLEFEAGSNIGLAFSSGKLTISATDTTYGGDRGISLVSGNFGHSNSTVTAVTTAGLYKVKYDTYGHITGTTAVAKTDITALGIPESDTNTTYSLTVSGTGDNANKLGLTAGGSGSGTTWVTIPYATNAGTASSASSVAWANVSGHDAGVDADLGINTSSGDTTKFLNAKGGWAVPYTHPTYTSATAAAVKVGRDATGHVVIGSALTASDVGALSSSTTYVSSVNGSSGAVTGIQTTGNLTTTISSSSTDTQYPSALAVYTALQSASSDAAIFRKWTA